MVVVVLVRHFIGVLVGVLDGVLVGVLDGVLDKNGHWGLFLLCWIRQEGCHVHHLLLFPL